jgi:hypothetical protein
MKNKLFTLLITVFFLSQGLFVSCTTPHSEGKEVKERFHFITYSRPYQNWEDIFTSTLNTALVEEAEKTGKDKVLQMGAGASTKAPSYHDVAFFPILNAADLQKLVDPYIETLFGMNGQYLTKKVDSIDFKKNFVLIIGHPIPTPMMLSVENGGQPQTQGYYTDRVLDNGVENKKRNIQLKTRRLGRSVVASGLEVFTQNWGSTVYIVEKKNSDSLLLQIDKNTFSFSLKKK